MSQNLSEESLIRNYFLGELREDEQDLVQERLLVDRKFFETSLIIEDELMDDYALGLLSLHDRIRLEEGLLRVPQQYQRVQLTRTLGQFILKSDTPTSSGEELPESEARSLRFLIEEEAVARKYVTTRYQTLIDRKYLNGLSPSESEELDGLRGALDAMDEPYYDSIIKRLRRLVEERGVQMPHFVRRVPAPNVKGGYRSFRPFVREDFLRQCAFCLFSELLVGGEEGFELDHFRPRHLFPELLNDFYNLYYSCHPCNHIKRDSQPPSALEEQGIRFVDLCKEDFGSHFSVEADGRLNALTNPGDYTIDKLNLNRQHLVTLRGLLERLGIHIHKGRISEEVLNTLTQEFDLLEDAD